VNARIRYILFVLAVAGATAVAVLFLNKPVPKPARPLAKAPVAETRGLDASGRTLAERRAVEQALEAFKKEGLLVRAAEDRDAMESDDHRDLEEVYGGYHPFFVRGDLDGDGRLDFAQAFVEKGSAAPGSTWRCFSARETARSSRRSGPSVRSRSPRATSRSSARSSSSRPTSGWIRHVAGAGSPWRKRFVDADQASRRKDPADDDTPDETPDQKPRARV